jgi:hypothetical protein
VHPVRKLWPKVSFLKRASRLMIRLLIPRLKIRFLISRRVELNQHVPPLQVGLVLRTLALKKPIFSCELLQGCGF